MWEARTKYNAEFWCDADQTINHLTTLEIGCRRDVEGKYHRTGIANTFTFDIRGEHETR
jgi:hypothetical protein